MVILCPSSPFEAVKTHEFFMLASIYSCRKVNLVNMLITAAGRK